MTMFAFDPARSVSALASMGASGGERVTLPSRDLAQGLFGALVSAELMAADAGVIPWVEFPDGAGGMFRGVASVGGARDRIDDPSRWSRRSSDGPDPAAVRALYLGAHGAVRQTHATAQTTPAGVGRASDVGLIPVGVYLVALGVAAIVATAAYAVATENARTTVSGENARQTTRVTTAIELAKTEMQHTGKIPRELWAFLNHEADAEAAAKAPAGVPMALFAGAAILIGGGYVYLRGRDGHRGVFA